MIQQQYQAEHTQQQPQQQQQQIVMQPVVQQQLQQQSQQQQQQQGQRAVKAVPKRKEDFSHKTELAFIDSGINSHYSKKKPVKQRMVVVQQQPVQPVADEYDPSSQDQEDVLAT